MLRHSLHPRVELACTGVGTMLLLAGCNMYNNVRPGAKSIFEAFSPPPTEQGARWAINPYDADQRYKGTLMLANAPFAGEPLYIQLFIENARDADAGVRAVSMRALGTHGGPEHAPMLTTGLKYADPLVRTEAARGLQRIHAPEAIDPLLASLDRTKEDDPHVRVEAATALGQYRTPEVVAQLIAALGDDNLAVNTRVRDSLQTLTGQDFVDVFAYISSLPQ